jgi:lipoprotein-releasing system ATP-binding protein
MTTALDLIDVKKSFNQANHKIEVIKGVNLQVKKGEFVALTGPSGSGKTTILQIAGLLDNPSSGKVFINGIDASKADDRIRTLIRKENIGFVYQFHHLLPEFSALENVMMPLLIQGKSKSDAKKNAEEILEEVDLKNRINHKPSELSGGQQQRVALARAIVAKPSLILADEPTGNLDSEMSVKIFNLLNSLVRAHKIGCLVVTHNNELAAKTDRIISIKDGLLL